MASSRPFSAFPPNDFNRETEYNYRPPPSNSLYPESRQPLSNDFYPEEDSFLSRNLPSWQRNRGELGSNQDHNIDSAPWNRSSRPDSWPAERSVWNESQEGPSNSRSSYTNFGRSNRDYGRFASIEDPSTCRDSSRGGNFNEDLWNDRPMNSDRNEWNNAPSHSNDPHNEFEKFSDSNQSRLGASHVDQWANRSSVSRDQTYRFERSDRTDMPHTDEWLGRNQNQTNYNEPNRQSRPHWESISQENEWENRQGPSHGNEWKDDRQYSENRGMTLKNQSSYWNDDRTRQFRGPEWTSHLSQGIDNRNWGDRSGDPLERSNSGPSNRSNQSLDRYREPQGRDHGRKRERSSENPDVWSRLKPKTELLQNLTQVKKKLKLIDEKIAKRVNMKPELKSPSVLPKKNFVSTTVGKQNRNRNPFEVQIHSQHKKQKLILSDKEDIEDKLANILHSMARSENVNSLPEIKIEGIKLLKKGVIVIICHDVVTLKWMLQQTWGFTRLPLRTILPEDPAQLALIGVITMPWFGLSPFKLKLALKTQNPHLDVSKWVEGETFVNKSKVKNYIYQVDGHTLRYLVHNHWQLYLDMYKIRVKHFKTNFNFNPATYTHL